jgi:hypothetical protein
VKAWLAVALLLSSSSCPSLWNPPKSVEPPRPICKDAGPQCDCWEAQPDAEPVWLACPMKAPVPMLSFRRSHRKGAPAVHLTVPGGSVGAAGKTR